MITCVIIQSQIVFKYGESFTNMYKRNQNTLYGINLPEISQEVSHQDNEYSVVFLNCRQTITKNSISARALWLNSSYLFLSLLHSFPFVPFSFPKRLFPSMLQT